MVEVMDHWPDAGLTAGERSDLLVIAENANDQSRETYPKGGMHQEYILKRVGKTAAAWKNAIGKLMKKGVLAYATRDGRELSGFPGQVAVYRLTALCPAAPHDGLLGQCTRSERVTSQVTQSAEPDQTGHLSGDPNPGMGHLTEANGSPHRWERVTSQVTPTPLSPQTPLSPPPQAATSSAAAQSNNERETIHQGTEPILAAYVAAIGRPVSPTTRTKLQQQAVELLAAGFPAWWLTDRAAELAAKGWTDLAQHCDRSTVPTVRKAADSKADWCGTCQDPNYRMRKDPARDNELVECDDCHPAAVARRRRRDQGAAA